GARQCLRRRRRRSRRSRDGMMALAACGGTTVSEKAEKLKAELASLSLEERDDIRAYLESLEDEELTQEEWEAAWSEEVNRRVADMESGKTKRFRGRRSVGRCVRSMDENPRLPPGGPGGIGRCSRSFL